MNERMNEQMSTGTAQYGMIRYSTVPWQYSPVRSGPVRSSLTCLYKPDKRDKYQVHQFSCERPSLYTNSYHFNGLQIFVKTILSSIKELFSTSQINHFHRSSCFCALSCTHFYVLSCTYFYRSSCTHFYTSSCTHIVTGKLVNLI